MHVAPHTEDTLKNLLSARLTTRITQITSSIEKERANVVRPRTSADAIARGSTKLVALTDELQTLQELAREVETRDRHELVVFIVGALASIYARTAGRPEAVRLTDLASDLARMVRDLLEDASA